ncbi:glycosyltransferase family 2 protein [Aestuariibacter salexigens]|uniref:glycosyltransferase family 2 protein n=1 Tax=Aestuariibacter salexigens TaxID=226010 RepID=UPI000479382D|nr:glycosyltransferase family 2 protein [Aestuariibacter salexigens]
MSISEHNTAIIIPAKNEAMTLGSVLSDLHQHVDAQVIVVDDGSDDDTRAIAEKHGAMVFPHVTNMGAWRATQTGIRFAHKKGFDRVVTLDADGQHRAEDVKTLVAAAEQGFDVVIGSCTSRGSAGRHIAWRIFKTITRLPVFDLTSGFRCYSRSAMKALASRQATMFEYQDVGVLLLLRNLQLKCIEVPVTMNRRKDGISRIFYSWFAVIRYLLYTLILSSTKAFPGHSRKVAERLAKD